MGVGADSSRNLVLCLDGTGNKYRGDDESTNVVRVYRLLDQNRPDQTVFYSTGLGTLPSRAVWTPIGRDLTKVSGLALGSGFSTNLSEAYVFLMRTWRPGDRIFIFAFSRGAYTARALCGLLHYGGMLRPPHEDLVPHLVSAYRHCPKEDLEAQPATWGEGSVASARDPVALLRGFSTTFCQPTVAGRSVDVTFLGLWDTVKALARMPGSAWHIAGTRELRNVQMLRHAVSLDESRAAYPPYLNDDPDPDGSCRVRPSSGAVEEAWFPGVHSDVGGSGDSTHVLPLQALRWVLKDAPNLRFVAPHDGSCTCAELCAPPSYRDTHISENDTAYFLPPWPNRLVLGPRRTGVGRVPTVLRHWRSVPNNAHVHRGVDELEHFRGVQYQPKNLPNSFQWMPLL